MAGISFDDSFGVLDFQLELTAPTAVMQTPNPSSRRTTVGARKSTFLADHIKTGNSAARANHLELGHELLSCLPNNGLAHGVVTGAHVGFYMDP